MATRTISAAGGNYNALGTWVEGAVPTSSDTVICLPAGASGPLVVNVTSVALSIDFTNYTNTLSGSSTLTVSGNVTLVTGMTLTYSGLLILNATATLTSAGKTFTAIQFAGTTITYTLADDCNTGALTIGGAGTITLNGNTINNSGSLTMTTQSGGTTNIVLNGTGTWSGSGSLRSNLTINTAGTITLSGSISYGTSTFTYTTGTTITAGSTLTLAAACTINVNGSSSASPSTTSSTGINFNNFTITPTATITLSSNICVVGNISITASPTFSGSYGIYASGDVAVSQILSSPNTTLYLVGTGTLSSTGGSAMALPIIINTTGVITFGTSVNKSSGLFQWLSGLVNTEGSTFTMNGATLTVDTGIGIIFNNITISGNATVTLSSDLYTKGTFTHGSSNTATIINGFNIYINGNYSIASTSGSQTGTTIFNLNGIGTITSTQTSNAMQHNLNINGRYIADSFRYSTNTLTLNGFLDGKNCTLTLGTCTLINLHRVVFRAVTVTGASTLTMNKPFNGSPAIKTIITSSNTTNYTITFQDNFEKICKFVKISYCTLTRRPQLMVITDKGNGGNNIGIRYINNIPNGIARNIPTVYSPACFGIEDGFANDPLTRN